jgi:hypothetical protein
MLERPSEIPGAPVQPFYKSSKITQSGPAPPAQEELQLATEAALLRSNPLSSASFARTAMLLSKVTRIHAGAGRILHQRHKRTHLIDGESELATASDEGEALHISSAVDALVAGLAAC